MPFFFDIKIQISDVDGTLTSATVSDIEEGAMIEIIKDDNVNQIIIRNMKKDKKAE